MACGASLGSMLGSSLRLIVIKLLRRDELALVLKEEHAEALETDEAARGLAQQVVSILGVLEKNSKHAQASTAGRSNWSGWYRRGVIARIILYPSYFSITNSQLK